MSNERLKKNCWFGYLCVLLCWSIQAYFTFGQLLLEGKFFACTVDGRPYVCDFAGFYGCAVLAKRCTKGEQLNIYDVNVQSQSINQITAPVIAEAPFWIQYPPWFFTLVLPLSYFPITQAWLIWSFLGAVLVAGSVWLLAFGFHKTSFSRVFVMAAVFASYPTWLCFRLGQPALLNFAGLTLFWWLLGRSKFFSAGLSAGILAVKLQYLPLALIVGLIRGRLRFLLGLLSISATLLVLGILTVGWSNIISYPNLLLSRESGQNVSGVTPELMQNFRGALVLITNADDQLVRIAVIGFLLLVIFSGAALFLRPPTKARSIERDFKIKASICSLLMLIASPHTHVQDYLVATIPALWLWQVISGRSAPLLRTLILAFPVMSWLFYFLRPLFMLAHIQPFFIWALLVIFLAIKELRRPIAPGGIEPAESGDARVGLPPPAGD
jgi:hypothetical protein